MLFPSASSCSEVLYTLLEDSKISRNTAECLYTGIVHDTGVFKYSNTSKRTMEIAGNLVDKGLNSAKIIDDSFYRKTYVQNQVLGRALLESFLFMDGRCIFTALKQKDLDFTGRTAMIWTVLLISSGLRKESSAPFSFTRKNLMYIRSACAQ